MDIQISPMKWTLALTVLFVLASFPQNLMADTKEVLVAPAYSPKTDDISQNGSWQTFQQIQKDYEDKFKGAYEHHSYGQQQINIKALDYIKLPWAINKAPGSKTLSITEYNKGYGIGEKLLEKRDGGSGASNQAYNDSGKALVDGFFTPGERFQDLNGDGKYTALTPFYDTQKITNDKGIEKGYDLYGEEFVDWDDDKKFTLGNTSIEVYDLRKDSGKGADSSWFGGLPGDGIMGSPTVSSPKYAVRTITLSEMDLNTSNHFSAISSNDTAGYTSVGNSTASVNLRLVYPGDWASYIRFIVRSSGNSVATQTISTNTTDFSVLYAPKTDASGNVQETYAEMVTFLNAHSIVTGGSDNLFQYIPSSNVVGASTSTNVLQGTYTFGNGTRYFNQQLDGDRAWNYYNATSNPGTPTTTNAIPLNGTFNPNVVDSKDDFTSADNVTYQTVLASSGNASIVTTTKILYRSAEIVDGNKGVFTNREPFQDFLLRWDHTLGKKGDWVVASQEYIVNNYPGNGVDGTSNSKNPPSVTGTGAVTSGNLFYYGGDGFGYNNAADALVLMTATANIIIHDPLGVYPTAGNPIVGTDFYSFGRPVYIDANEDGIFSVTTEFAFLNQDSVAQYSSTKDIALNSHSSASANLIYVTISDIGVVMYEDANANSSLDVANELTFIDVNLNGSYSTGDGDIPLNSIAHDATSTARPVLRMSFYNASNSSANISFLTSGNLIYIESDNTTITSYTPNLDIMLVNNANIASGPNTIPDNIDELLARIGNGIYDGPDPFEDKFNSKMQVYGKDDTFLTTSAVTGHWKTTTDYTANGSITQWWTAAFGTSAPAELASGNTVPSWKPREFDPISIRPFAKKGLVQSFKAYNAVESGNIYPDADGKYYDGPREFRDLPSSIYHRGGDLRLGEENDPASTNIDGANYSTSVSAPLTYKEFGGPMATQTHGHTGFNTGNQFAIEFLTWRTDGSTSATNIVVGSSWVGQDSVARETRDINLDGLIDQGASPSAGFCNYINGANPNTPENGTAADDYPFNRERLMEDILEANDQFVDYDQLTSSGGPMDYLVCLPISGAFQPLGSGTVTKASSDKSSITFRYNVGQVGWTSIMYHESNHDFYSSPDLYDTAVFSDANELIRSPMGSYDAMASGSFNATVITQNWNGWVSPKNIRSYLVPGEEITLKLYPKEQTNNSFYFYGRNGLTTNANNEYYWFYYEAGNVPTFSNPKGLYIVYGNNNYNSEGLPSSETQNNANVPTYAVIQADGLKQLESGTNRGDSNDVFGDKVGLGITVFDQTREPRNSWSDGIYAGLDITNIVLPVAGDILSPALVTFKLNNTDVPSTTFINPPNGTAFGGSFNVKMSAYDKLGASSIYLFRNSTASYSGASTKTTDAQGTTLGKGPGIKTLSYVDDVTGLTGGYYYFTKIIGGSNADHIPETNHSVYTPTNSGNGTCTDITVTLNTTSLAATEATQQLWTLNCVTGGASATFSVSGSHTGLEASQATVGDPYKTSLTNYSGLGFTIKSNSGNTQFAAGDKFYIRTAGLSPISDPINLLNGSSVGLETIDPSLVILPISNETNEGGAKATFEIKLSKEPASDVVVSFTSSDESEVVVETGALIFNTLNWNNTQLVTVRGVDDTDIDGLIAVTITAKSSSNAPLFNNLQATTSISNRDDDTYGLVITPANQSLYVSESGLTQNITVNLISKPANTVTVTFVNSDTTELLLSKTSLTFTTANYKVPQLLTLSGNNDSDLDGNQYVDLIMQMSSPDNNYNNLTKKISVINVDDEYKSLIVQPASGPTQESGLSAYFTIQASASPSTGNTIQLSFASSDETEGKLISKSLTIDEHNFNTPQKVWVQGMDDSITDGPISYTISVNVLSGDADFDLLKVDPVTFINEDNDLPGVTIGAIKGQVTESGGKAQFTVRLNSAPIADVFLPVNSSSVTEGTVDKSLITFTKANWSGEQVITVTGVDDAVVDGATPFLVELKPLLSTDGNYAGLDPKDVAFTNIDNDSAGLLVNMLDDATSENLDSATFEISLTKAPLFNVTLSLLSNDTTEGNFTGGGANIDLVFTPTNYSQVKTLMVYGVDDSDTDGDINYSISGNFLYSTDTDYKALGNISLSFINLDNETPNVVVTPVTSDVSESGTSATFTVALTTAPTALVTLLPLSITNTAEATISAANLIFTKTNYNIAQPVTIVGKDDALMDGDVVFGVVLGAIVSDDSKYNGIDPLDFTMVNKDNDQAGVYFSKNSFTTYESDIATAHSLSIKLYTQPKELVTFYATMSDNSEGVITSTNTITFTPSNYATEKTLTFTSNVDSILDGDVKHYLTFSPITSLDTNYSSIVLPSIPITNIDKDTPNFIFDKTSLSITEGSSGNFSVSLSAAPTADVALKLTSSSSNVTFSPSPLTLTFNSTDYGTPQQVTLTAVEDLIIGNGLNSSVTFTVTTTDTTGYALVRPSNVTVTTIDNDIPSLGFTLTDVFTGETSGNTGSISLKLGTIPSGNVVVTAESSNTGEVTVSPASVTFAPGSSNTEPFTFTGVDDSIDDGDQAVTITFTVVSTDDSNYFGLSQAQIVTNVDNDTKGVTTSGVATSLDENGSTGFTVVLNSQPTSTVTVAANSLYPTKATVLPASLSFTTGNWNSPQTINVYGVDNGVIGGDVAGGANISLSLSSSDPLYNGLAVTSISMNIIEDDSASLSLREEAQTIFLTEGGLDKVLKLKLGAEPTDTVVVSASSSNTLEATIYPTTFTFNAQNWMLEQSILVESVDDGLSDDQQSFTVTCSTDSTNTLDATFKATIPKASKSLTSYDNEVSTVLLSKPSAALLGGGESITVDVHVTKPFTGTLNFTGSGVTSGVNIVPSSMTMIAGNSLPDFKISVYADNTISTGTLTLSASSSTTTLGAGASLSITTQSASDATLWKSYATEARERDGTWKVSARLSKAPTSNVTVTFSSSDSTEITGTPSLTFTSSNYAQLQIATMSVVADGILDGDRDVIITWLASSSDTSYNNLTGTMSVKILDDQKSQIIIRPVASHAGEWGRTALYEVYPTTKPESDLTMRLALQTQDQTISSLDKSSLVFTPSNYTTSQTFSVNGIVNDALTLGHQGVLVGLTTTGGGNAFTNVKIPNLLVPLSDDEKLSFALSANTFTLSESDNALSTNTSFTVALSHPPAGNVTLTFTPSKTTYVSMSSKSLTFNAKNWSTVQTIALTGLDVDLPFDEMFTITGDVSSYTDPHFRSAPSVTLSANLKSISINVSTLPTLSTSGTDFIFNPIDQVGVTQVQFLSTGGQSTTYTYALVSGPSGNTGTLSSDMFTMGNATGRYEFSVISGVESKKFGMYVQGAPNISSIALKSGKLNVKVTDLTGQYYIAYYSTDSGNTWIAINGTPVQGQISSPKPRYSASTSTVDFSVDYTGPTTGTIFKVLSSNSSGSVVSVDPPASTISSYNTSSPLVVESTTTTGTTTTTTGTTSPSSSTSTFGGDGGSGGGGCLMKGF
jgi:hypothetical protein